MASSHQKCDKSKDGKEAKKNNKKDKKPDKLKNQETKAADDKKKPLLGAKKRTYGLQGSSSEDEPANP